jgi:hypothetical protein
MGQVTTLQVRIQARQNKKPAEAGFLQKPSD